MSRTTFVCGNRYGHRNTKTERSDTQSDNTQKLNRHYQNLVVNSGAR